jgi:hypothetical protein
MNVKKWFCPECNKTYATGKAFYGNDGMARCYFCKAILEPDYESEVK